MKAAAVFLLAALASTAAAGHENQDATFFFRSDWCPSDVESDRLTEDLVLTRDRCCIVLATPRHPATFDPNALSPWRDKIVPPGDPSLGACTGDPSHVSSDDKARIASIEAENRRRADAAAAEEAREVAEAQAAHEAADRARIAELAALDADFLRRAPALFAALPLPDFCATFGEMYRARKERAAAARIADAAVSEARRRRLSLNHKQIEAQRVRIGDSECQMLAALGHPIDQHRSVGSWGVDVQFVFGDDEYVYTRNGVVTSFQD